MTKRKRTSPTVGDLVRALDAIAPLELAAEWDNVGLLAGDHRARCNRVLVTIDLTPAVLAEAEDRKCQLIVSYHPPLFRPMKRILADSQGTDALIHGVIRAGVAVYSPHTALDAAPGGTNDVLASLCGLADVEAFEDVSVGAPEYKVVTFVPAADVERVAGAMFSAGAGRIGEYEQCSYRLEGKGTFFGTESTHPRVGRKGRCEHVRETRIEMVVPRDRLGEVAGALRGSHPYEEPAFDIYALVSAPRAGMGRVGQLPADMTLGRLAASLKRATRSRVVTIVGARGKRVRRAAVCVGAAGRLPLECRRSADCDVIVTGEIRHHDALTIQRAGKSAIALGHWESERPVLAPLAKRLASAVSGVRLMVSRRDVGPFGSV